MEARRNVRSLNALAVSLFSLSSYRPVLVGADDTLNGVVSGAFDFAGQQLTVLKEDVLVDNDIFTSYTDADGQWITTKDNGDVIDLTVWTSGMVAGMCWYQYEVTGQSIWQTYAEDMQEGLEGVELLDDNDLGFQTLNSYGLGYRLVGTSSFKDRTLSGAQSLYDYRYVSNIPAFWSWANPTSEPQWERAVNVDMIMNMEIMLWAAVNGGDAEYSDAVENHADTTWADLVRDDYSTYHVADYDPSTGELVDKGTYQGWQDESTWSRGQAWAIYGFTMVHRYLKEQRFLDYAINTLSYFVDNLPDDNVPYADFDAPVDSDNPKDSSATAIVTSTLFELFELTGECRWHDSCYNRTWLRCIRCQTLTQEHNRPVLLPRLLSSEYWRSMSRATIPPCKPTQPCLLYIPPQVAVCWVLRWCGKRTQRVPPLPTFPLISCRQTTGEPAYLEKAQEFLSSLLLSSTYFDSLATDGWQAILRNSAAAWGDEAVGSVTADYFLLESMASGSASLV
ncbi:unnamed protein product [Ectocarpus sp. 12 AP-2014]